MYCGARNTTMRAIASCFCFVLVSVYAVEQHKDEPQKFSISKTLPTLEEGFRTIQHEAAKHFVSLIKTQTLDTQEVLSSFPEKCSRRNWNSVQAEKKKALRNFLTCNFKAIGKNVVLLYSETTDYYTDMKANITYLETEVLQCIEDGDPITCFIQLVSELEETFVNIVTLVEDYESEVSTLVPKIMTGIKNCLSKSSSDYQKFLATVKETNKKCIEN